MKTIFIALLLPIATQAFFFGNSCGCQSRPVCPPAPVCAPPPPPVCPPAPVCGGAVNYGYQTQPVYQPQPVQQQQQYYQQLPVAGYAQPQQQQEFVSAPLAAQADNQELTNGGQQATVEERLEEVAPVAVEEEQAPIAQPTEEVASTAAPAEGYPASVTESENTVYDDIVNAAQGATATEEYHAAAQSRRRYHSIRRAPAAAFDPKCNSETLKTIIQNNIGDSTSSSKRAIQKAAAEEIGGHVDVICSTGTFSYIVNTEIYCETEKDGITCFAFRQSN